MISSQATEPRPAFIDGFSRQADSMDAGAAAWQARRSQPYGYCRPAGKLEAIAPAVAPEADTFAHAAGLLLLKLTHGIRKFESDARELMQRYLIATLAQIRSAG
jgi:hypothetical protein